MGAAKKMREYAYITSNPDIVGGVPIVEGTRTTVRAISGYYLMGMTEDEILGALTHLTEAQVYSALAYYFDHREEIDADRRLNDDTDHWKRQAINYVDWEKTT